MFRPVGSAAHAAGEVLTELLTDEDQRTRLLAAQAVVALDYATIPPDLVAPLEVLLKDDDVVDAAVIAVPSEQWGETPLGLVVLREGAEGDLEAIRERANQQLGKGQRLSGLERRDELPRSTIGKILKRELRDPYWKDLEQSKRD